MTKRAENCRKILKNEQKSHDFLDVKSQLKKGLFKKRLFLIFPIFQRTQEINPTMSQAR